MRIDQSYHNLKEALKNQMGCGGGQDKGLSLTKEGQMTQLLEISET